MKYAIRALLAVAGGAFVGAAMYAFALARHAEDLAYGFTVWQVLWREFLAVSILVALALATPRRRGLRPLWLLVGALWVWLLVLPPIDTADAGPPGVAFLYRFQNWSGIALPLFLTTLVHWSPAYRSIRDLRTPAALLAVWIGAYSVCARYAWINSDLLRDINYEAVALSCWIFLAAPPLLLIRWILGRDREVYPAQTRAEAWLWSGLASLVRSRLTATMAGIIVATPGFIAIRIFQGERGLFADWMVLICSLLAGPGLGMALRGHTGTASRASRMAVMATGPARP